MRVYLRTFGCRANQYDTEAVREMIGAAGHTIVASARDADVAVFNSCAVTAAAEADLRQGVRRAARENRALRSVVMGCAAALDRGTIRSLPTVSHTVQGADLAALAAALDLPPSAATNGLTRAQSSARATLRIQDGCDEHCTFCATTIARGSTRSRVIDAVVAEAAVLAERHQEIVLTGIHIGSWGVDLGQPLSVLVEHLVRQVPAVRFRLSSLEATEVDGRLRELLRSDDGRLAPHLHAPLQSGSNDILRRMGRHWYTAESYASAVSSLVRDRDVFGLGADVISGFPGETEDDHGATLRLIEQLPFTYLHVFPYSPRPGTAATRLGPPASAAVVERRTADLRALAHQKATVYRATRVGALADIVITRGGPRCEGITEDFLTIAMRQPVSRGSRLRARLTNDGGSLFGTPEAVEAASLGYLSPS
ncbi:MAG TPA: MiaB/RimO family radical SAM methylthiotransferase [Gemmatimonadaceae bacterium]|nr:MiaB/RimO family radical SAM methylthiotransferase [Gemmatimonadaceae bacterium]